MGSKPKAGDPVTVTITHGELRWLEKRRLNQQQEQAMKEHGARIEEENERREHARQAEAEEWTRRFQAAGLDLKARMQTTRWVSGLAEPEIWIEAPEREKSWEKLLDLLDPTFALISSEFDPDAPELVGPIPDAAADKRVQPLGLDEPGLGVRLVEPTSFEDYCSRFQENLEQWAHDDAEEVTPAD